jgi:hypothetical protein
MKKGFSKTMFDDIDAKLSEFLLFHSHSGNDNLPLSSFNINDWQEPLRSSSAGKDRLPSLVPAEADGRTDDLYKLAGAAFH